MDQVLSFVGQHTDLTVAIQEAQNAANAWLQQHSMSVATIYSSSSQSIWHERDGGHWYHVLILTLQYYQVSSSTASDIDQDQP